MPAVWMGSMRETVDQIIDAQLVRLVRFVERPEPSPRPFPVLRDVGVVVDHHQQPLRGIVVLEYPPENRMAAVVSLREVLQRRDLEKRVIDRMRGSDLEEARLGQDAL